MQKIWNDKAWDDYVYWQTQDKRTLKRINALLKDIERDPFDGIGDPEPLKWNLHGYWSREINGGNRLVYKVIGKGKARQLKIASCRTHYDAVDLED
jgi:toxin YoeB